MWRDRDLKDNNTKEEKNMPVYKRDKKIIGFRVRQKVYCLECYKELGEPSTGAIQESDLEENLFHCDKCGEEIE